MSSLYNCPLPPNVTMFRITEASSKAVRLRWSHRYIKSTDRFQYELEWRNQDEQTEIPAKLILNMRRAKTVILSDLQPESNYVSQILTRNECGDTSLPLAIGFSTKPQILQVPQTMFHEFILIALILLIWLMILRHFIKVYEKMTFVSPNTVFVGGRKYSEQKIHKTSDVDSVRRGSDASKASVTNNKFELLEDVVSKWRSETFLEMRNRINKTDVASVMDRTDIASVLSAEDGRRFSAKRKRRTSNATDDLGTLTVPKDLVPKYSAPTTLPSSHSYPFFLKSGSNITCPNCPEIYYEDYDNSLTVPPRNQPTDTSEVDEEELEKCRLLSKISGPQQTRSEMLQADTTMRRKVSEVLLGRATVDIRRCSLVSAYVRRPRASKNALVRQSSLFQSFRNSIRRKRRTLKGQGCSLNASESVKVQRKLGNNIRQMSLTEKPDEYVDSPTLNKHVKLQMSTESYFTAADVLIQIEPENQ